MMSPQHDEHSLGLARRYTTPRTSYVDGVRHALRRYEHPSAGMKLRFVMSLMTIGAALATCGWIAGTIAAAICVAIPVTTTLVIAHGRRSRIDEEAVDLLARDAQSIMRNGLLQPECWDDDESESNRAMSRLLDDKRPNRAAIRRRAATAMVEVRCLHSQTMRDIDPTHQPRAIDQARRALRTIRDEALAAIVPVQDSATDLLSERLTSIVAPERGLQAPTAPDAPPKTGCDRFDDLVARVQQRIDLGDDPLDAGGSPVAPLVRRHLPAVMAAHLGAIRDGGDRAAAQALLDRSLEAMTRSFEEALAQPLPTARSAMEELETQTRFLESRADRSLSVVEPHARDGSVA